MHNNCGGAGSRAVAIPGSESSGSSHCGSPRPHSVRSPFARTPSYAADGDEDEDGSGIDPEDLWAPMGTPIPPATSELPALHSTCQLSR